VHHEPPTSYALLAVVFYSFVFLGIVRFFKKISRAQASVMEVWVRDFLLYSITKFQVVLMESGALAQILAQAALSNPQFFHMSSMFFSPWIWHKSGTNAAQTA